MQLHSIRAGTKSERHPTPLLFLHGAWHASWCWEENFIPYFSGEGLSCNAFDLRGHGKSEGVEHLNDFHLKDYVEDLTQQAEALDKPPVLIAHSMGGLVAQMYAQDHVVAGLALLAPVPLGGVGYGYARAHPIPFLRAVLTRRGLAMVKGEELARSLFFSPGIPHDVFMKFYEKLQDESFSALLEVGRGAERKPLKGSPPLLIVQAERDAVIPAKGLEDTARFYGTETTRLDSAHDVMIDVRWKGASSLLMDWMDKNGF